MKISESFGRGRPVFSFEFFPPKTAAGEANLTRALDDLRPLGPTFVSVTWGAGGSTRERTVDLVTRLQREGATTTMAHLTCVGASRADLAATVDRLVAEGISNFIALRGDPPAGETSFRASPDGLLHAADLVALIRERHGSAVCIAGAGYPEGHVECRDLAQDLAHLRAKVDAGLDLIVTQLFFDNAHYFNFVARARAAGIKVPIVPGIMPITNVAQIERFTRLCGATIPKVLADELDRCRDDPGATLQLGVAHATAQCVGLLAGGAPGVHFYTLNQSPATRVILTALKAARLA